MNAARLSPDDPRLTAYALGELDAAEIPAVEAALRTDATLRTAVEEIRACTAAMKTALAHEALPAAPVTPLPRAVRPVHRRSRWIVFPQFYFLAGGLAAASLAVFVAINRERITARERMRADHRRAAFEPPGAGQPGASSSTVFAVDLTSPVSIAPPVRFGGGFVLTPDFGQADYAAVRRHLEARQLPPAAAVRPAALVNAFRYRHPAPPAAGGAPLAAALEVGATPWAPDRRLVRIGLRGREVAMEETRQVIVDGLARTAATIAKDVRIQVEFNPAKVAGYRLVGRERDSTTRDAPTDELATAGEMISGQVFTALYEIVPAAPAAGPAPGSTSSGARPTPPSVLETSAGELLTVRLHFVEPEGGQRRTLAFPLAESTGRATAPSADLELATAAAEFAQWLRTGPGGSAAVLRNVLTRAESAAADPAGDSDGRRAEFVVLVRQAQLLLE